jgi:urea transporter
VPPIGVAAAIGLILFFIAAITTHLRARDYSFGLAGVFLLLAGAALVLRLASA